MCRVAGSVLPVTLVDNFAGLPISFATLRDSRQTRVRHQAPYLFAKLEGQAREGVEIIVNHPRVVQSSVEIESSVDRPQSLQVEKQNRIRILSEAWEDMRRQQKILRDIRSWHFRNEVRGVDTGSVRQCHAVALKGSILRKW
ncbi:hypothetical protein KCU77_g78, partial [Aureobasidium melanogenum]